MIPKKHTNLMPRKVKLLRNSMKQEASSTQINLNPNYHESKSQEERESVDGPKLDTEERIEITDSIHDHDKSSSSSSDDESQQVNRKEDSEVNVSLVPDQLVPVVAGLMVSNAENIFEISTVDTIISNEDEITTEVSLASDKETKQASSSCTTLSESRGVAEGSKESEVVISHEYEAPVRPTHGVVQRTSWLSCCGLFDVISESSR